MYVYLFFELYGDHRDLHVLTHSFPTRRSSDLGWGHHQQLLRLRLGSGHPQPGRRRPPGRRGLESSEEHTSEPQSLMRISYAVLCLKKKQSNMASRDHNITQLKSGPYCEERIPTFASTKRQKNQTAHMQH